jgi:YhcH/YjgK/YiaL family protein
VILDRLDRSNFYARLGTRFAAGFRYLRSIDLNALEDGWHSVQGSDVVALVQTYHTRPIDEGRWESHRRHADIQLVVRGSERMGAAPLSDLKVLPPYDPEKDVEFHAGDASSGQIITVSAGEFALFLPHDLHMPGLQIDGPAEVKKVVVKICLE